MSRQLIEDARKVLTQEAAVTLDPVGREDNDIDNDGDSDKTDSYLKKRRGAISAAIAKGKNESNLSVDDIARLKSILGEQGVAEGLSSERLAAVRNMLDARHKEIYTKGFGKPNNPPTYNVIHVQTGKSVGTFKDGAGFMPGAKAKAMGLKQSPSVPNGHKVDYKSIVSAQGVAEGSLEEISLDLAKRARDKAEYFVDMDYDDLRGQPYGYSEKQRKRFQRYIDRKQPRAEGDRDWDPPNEGVAEGAMSDLDGQYQSHQAKTTMRHIRNPTAGEKDAAEYIKPGIAGYRDRIAMLKSAEARGGLKNEEAEQIDEISQGLRNRVRDARAGQSVERSLGYSPWPKGYEDPPISKATHNRLLKMVGGPGNDLYAKNVMGDHLYLRSKGFLKAAEVPPPKATPTKEDVDYEIIEKMHFQISDTPSFNDYLQAALKIAECKSLSELSEEDQKYIVGELEEAVANNDVGFIMEAESLSDMNDTVQRLRKAGHKVEDMGRDYRGNPFYVYIDKNSSLRRKVTYKNGQKMTQNMGRATPDEEEN